MSICKVSLLYYVYDMFMFMICNIIFSFFRLQRVLGAGKTPIQITEISEIFGVLRMK